MASLNPLTQEYNQIYDNTKSDLIQITDDKLRNILKDHISRLKKANDWLIPLSITITLLITFLTTDFSKDFLSISKSIWQGLFIIIFIISIIWLIIAIINTIKQRKSIGIECLLDEIKNKN